MIPHANNGLFSRTRIPAEQAIAEYRGQLFTQAQIDKKYGRQNEIVATYGVGLKTRIETINGKKVKVDYVLDPSQDVKSPYYTIAQFANDCLGSTSRFMRDIDRKSQSCNSNNARMVEVNRRVFVVAERDIYPDEEIFVRYGRSYWGGSRHQLFRVLYDHLAQEYRKNPERTFTAAELLVDLLPQLQQVWGKELRIRPLDKVSDALRLSARNKLFERTKHPKPLSNKQWEKYQQAHKLAAYFRKPPKKPQPAYQYRLHKAAPAAK
jgi:hypothetical protein